MCEPCRSRAERIAELAEYFRRKADETTLAHYIEIMLRATASLDALADHLRRRCQCEDLAPSERHGLAGWAEPVELAGHDDLQRLTQRDMAAHDGAAWADAARRARQQG